MDANMKEADDRTVAKLEADKAGIPNRGDRNDFVLCKVDLNLFVKTAEGCLLCNVEQKRDLMLKKRFPLWLAAARAVLPCSLAWVLFPVQLKQGCILGLEPAPLIGGPSWLKVHVKVVLQDNDHKTHKFDFVPKNPTDMATTWRILSFQSVPAELRYFSPFGVWKSKEDFFTVLTAERDENWIKEATKFCDSYENQDLNLISNNCWIFALQLYYHILQYSEEP